MYFSFTSSFPHYSFFPLLHCFYNFFYSCMFPSYNHCLLIISIVTFEFLVFFHNICKFATFIFHILNQISFCCFVNVTSFVGVISCIVLFVHTSCSLSYHLYLSLLFPDICFFLHVLILIPISYPSCYFLHFFL